MSWILIIVLLLSGTSPDSCHIVTEYGNVAVSLQETTTGFLTVIPDRDLGRPIVCGNTVGTTDLVTAMRPYAYRVALPIIIEEE